MKALFTTIMLCGASTAQAATLNGNFDDGFAGYTETAATNSQEVGPAPYVVIGDNGGNPYAELNTGTDVRDKVLVSSFTQSLSLGLNDTVFSFDVGQILDTANDFTSLGSAPFVPGNALDFFTFMVRDNTNNIGYVVFDLYLTGPDPDPFDTGAFKTTFGTSTDPFFDYNVTTDFSAVAGNDVTLTFALFSEFDGRQSVFAVDNLKLIETQISAVPLPAGAWMLLAGIASLALARRRAA